MFDPAMSTGSFGYREALAQVSAELTERLHDAHERRRCEEREPRGSLVIDGRGLALG